MDGEQPIRSVVPTSDVGRLRRCVHIVGSIGQRMKKLAITLTIFILLVSAQVPFGDGADSEIG